MRLSQKSLYHQVADVLRGEILTLRRPGDKIEPEVALAKRFGVSCVTIQQAMLLLSHEGLVIRRRGSGTFVADRADTRHVAVWCDIDCLHPRSSPVLGLVARRLMEFFEARRLPVKLYLGRLRPWETRDVKMGCPELAEALAAKRVRGVAAVGARLPVEWRDNPAMPPFVGASDTFRYRVRQDHTGAVRRATEFLLERGRTHLALIGCADFLKDKPGVDPAHEAFIATLTAHGAPIHAPWIRGDLDPAAEGSGWAQFREIWTASRRKPDGLIVTDDILFRDATLAILEMGIRVPEQLKIVAAANKGATAMHPFPVSRMQLDPLDFVEGIGTMLLALMEGQPVPSNRITPPFKWLDEDQADDDSAPPDPLEPPSRANAQMNRDEHRSTEKG